ncbi:hypothetical protein PUN28_001427 [Cardiocondyla obscurior]|uniref:Uncharacterized protein n=1 Tax=Cardiocondyla obscurior TaxID=286306 RepID=A0AAW2H578_9HYME
MLHLCSRYLLLPIYTKAQIIVTCEIILSSLFNKC